MSHIDQVELKPLERKSVSYAKCRAAIFEDFKEHSKSNEAGAKNMMHWRKAKVIEHLGGEREGHNITFADGSKARY